MNQVEFYEVTCRNMIAGDAVEIFRHPGLLGQYLPDGRVAMDADYQVTRERVPVHHIIQSGRHRYVAISPELLEVLTCPEIARLSEKLAMTEKALNEHSERLTKARKDAHFAAYEAYGMRLELLDARTDLAEAVDGLNRQLDTARLIERELDPALNGFYRMSWYRRVWAALTKNVLS